MRCKICDSILNDYETTRKDPTSGEYLDTCSYCIGEIRSALQDFEDTPYRYDLLLDDDEGAIDNDKEF